ncbi:hypothetical protein ACTJJ0_33870 [Chitinophaga sp. 22321]|uniref:Tetratricopeptide repeat-containing protein n=1 Tax=Chitinophaga hostae TaxID=2831022 RepID=A0ABS5JAM3_9BACT|nr:hypothetical protein [Chitinophaga hostae]MBS0032265.1 hypothetical protein [Chitinophaga hostae]
MDFNEFKQSLQDAHPPKYLSVYLESLWYDGKGYWEKAHDLVDDLPGNDAARVHAYLHRVEGDEANAEYWYSRAGETKPSYSKEQEWEVLVNQFL